MTISKGKEEYEQRIIKELTAFQDRLDSLAKWSEQFRSPEKSGTSYKSYSGYR